MNNEKVIVLKAREELPTPENKIHLKIKSIEIPVLLNINLKELGVKLNQVIFMLNELNVRINKEDEVAMKKWTDFMEANK